MITVQNTPALAGMHSITESLRHVRPALATCLRGISGVDRDHVHASFFRFAVQVMDERTPGHVGHALCQSGAGEPLDVEIFVRDEIKARTQVGGQFAMEVESPVADAFVLSRNRFPCSSSTIATTRLPGQSALRSTQAFLSLPKVPRVVDGLAIAEYGKLLESEIDTRHPVDDPLLWGFSHVAGNADEPSASHITANLDILDFATHLPMNLESNPSELGHADVAGVSFARLDRDVPESKRIETVTGTKAWKARCIAGFDPAEECLKSALETTKCRTGHLDRDAIVSAGIIRISEFCQVAALVDVADGLTSHAPRVSPLLQGGVVEGAAQDAPFLEGPSLFGGRTHYELECADHPTFQLSSGSWSISDHLLRCNSGIREFQSHSRLSMRHKNKFRQCHLERDLEDGSVSHTTSYLPQKYAVVSRAVSLRDDDKNWSQGWVIVLAGKLVDQPPDWRSLVKGHRKMTGDNIPKRSANG